MFSRIRLCLHALARRGRRPRPSPSSSFIRRRRPIRRRCLNGLGHATLCNFV